MKRELLDEMPPLVRDFLNYLITVGNKSIATADEYMLDLRTFFRFMKVHFGLSEMSEDSDLKSIDITDIDIDFIKRIRLTDIYEYFNYLSRDKKKFYNSNLPDHGLIASSRSRKVSSIRSFFKFLETKAKLLDENPAAELELPKKQTSLVRYLTLDESLKLLESVDDANSERNYCIITLFLNCGLRVSELVGINTTDISEDILRVRGKGGKERAVYLNQAALDAIEQYMATRNKIQDIPPSEEKALFISRLRRRISTSTVKWLVKKYCEIAGLDPEISVHKLRHTSATLMYRNGTDVRALQELLGHKHLNTTEIYTHTDSEELRSAAQANPLAHVTRKKGENG